MRKVRALLVILVFLCTQFVFAQTAIPSIPTGGEAKGIAPVEMADAMRSNGKIYVVIGVVLIILAGLFIYLVSIDRKIGRIEKEIEEGKKH